MKKLLLMLVFSLFLVANGHSQGNGFIMYKQFDNEAQIMSWDSVYYIDVMSNGIPQTCCTFEPYFWVIELNMINNWQCCCFRKEAPGPSYHDFFTDASIPLNDTTLSWGNHPIFYERVANGSYPFYYTYKVGVRQQVGDDYYYGWWTGKITYDRDEQSLELLPALFELFETCYCSIPNYPLRIGQTSLDWGTEEFMEQVDVTIFPNPTSGMFTLTGKDLLSVEIHNALGQVVANVPIDGEIITLDLAGQPAGVYFINISDKDGKRCVKKVIKQ